MTENAPTLHELLDELRAVAKQLTEETKVPAIVEQDDGTTKVVSYAVPSLLEQLRDAKEHGGESTFKGKRGTPVPLNVAALDLLNEIETQAVEAHLRALRAEFTPEERIRALIGIAGRWTETGDVGWTISRLTKWRDAIEQMLDPKRHLHVAAACPACGVKTVRRQNDDGEWVNTPALQVDGQNGAVCLNKACGHKWPTTHLHLLEATIRQDQDANPPARLRSSTSGTTGQGGWTMDTPANCPNCEGPIDFQLVETGEDPSFKTFVRGEWDCTNRCYDTDPEGFRRALAEWQSGRSKTA